MEGRSPTADLLAPIIDPPDEKLFGLPSRDLEMILEFIRRKCVELRCPGCSGRAFTFVGVVAPRAFRHLEATVPLAQVGCDWCGMVQSFVLQPVLRAARKGW